MVLSESGKLADSALCLARAGKVYALGERVITATNQDRVVEELAGGGCMVNLCAEFECMLTMPREGLCVVSLMPLNERRASPCVGKVVATVSVWQQGERQWPLREDIYIKALKAQIRIEERPAAENSLLGNREEAAALF